MRNGHVVVLSVCGLHTPMRTLWQCHARCFPKCRQCLMVCKGLDLTQDHDRVDTTMITLIPCFLRSIDQGPESDDYSTITTHEVSTASSSTVHTNTNGDSTHHQHPSPTRECSPQYWPNTSSESPPAPQPPHRRSQSTSQGHPRWP